MSGGTLTRRTILQLLGWSGLFVLSDVVSSAAAESASQGPASSGRLPYYPDRESAAAVGTAFLHLRPGEANAQALLAKLGLPPASASPASPEWPMVERAHIVGLVAAHSSDFRQRRIVRLAGWMLSLTELRLCALVELSRREQRAKSGGRSGTPER